MKQVKNIMVLLSCIAYVFLWIVLFVYTYMMAEQGLLTCLQEAYGIYCLQIVIFIAITIFSITIYLLIKSKKHVKTLFFIFVVSVILWVSMFAFYNSATLAFQSFSREKWTNYPEQRYLMIDSLKSDYNIIGMDFQKVINLLGVPDYSSECYHEYHCDNGCIEIYFDNVGLSSIRFRDN